MASVLQVNEIKDSGGNNTGITVADSTANVTIGNLTATSLAGGTIGSSVVFPAGAVIQSFQSDKGQTSQFSSDQNAFTCQLGTTAGTSALKYSNSKVAIAIRSNLVKRNNDTSHYLTAYLSGGNLGNGSNGRTIRSYWGQNLGDNSYCGEGITVGIDSPASTTPTYYLAVVTSHGGNWQFYNIYFTFWEIKV